MDPGLSPDDERLYFISTRPLDGEGETKDCDLWFSVRTEDGWGPPRNAGPVINSDGEDYYSGQGTHAKQSSSIGFPLHANAFLFLALDGLAPLREPAEPFSQFQSRTQPPHGVDVHARCDVFAYQRIFDVAFPA